MCRNKVYTFFILSGFLFSLNHSTQTGDVSSLSLRWPFSWLHTCQIKMEIEMLFSLRWHKSLETTAVMTIFLVAHMPNQNGTDVWHCIVSNKPTLKQDIATLHYRWFSDDDDCTVLYCLPTSDDDKSTTKYRKTVRIFFYSCKVIANLHRL